MKILLVGAGGVGSAFCAIAKRRDFFEQIVVADYDEGKARQAAEAVKDARFSSTQVDAGSADAVAALVREHGITHVMNAVDPRFTMPIFNGYLAGGADYLDMAMSLSKPHPESPYSRVGVMLGEIRDKLTANFQASFEQLAAGAGQLLDIPGKHTGMAGGLLVISPKGDDIAVEFNANAQDVALDFSKEKCHIRISACVAAMAFLVINAISLVY